MTERIGLLLAMVSHMGCIRDRAIRRCGELLKQIEPAKGGDRKSEDYQRAGGGPLISRQQVASDAGMSPRQTKQAIRVANVPAEDFERQVESDKPPTVSSRPLFLPSEWPQTKLALYLVTYMCSVCPTMSGAK